MVMIQIFDFIQAMVEDIEEDIIIINTGIMDAEAMSKRNVLNIFLNI